MKLALLAFTFICLSLMPQLRMIAGVVLYDLRLARLAAVTIGEIAAACFNLNLGSGLVVTAAVLSALLAAALLLRLAQERSVPRAYWLAVTFNSVGLALLSPALWSMDLA